MFMVVSCDSGLEISCTTVRATTTCSRRLVKIMPAPKLQR